jgi:hypothetical protein
MDMDTIQVVQVITVVNTAIIIEMGIRPTYHPSAHAKLTWTMTPLAFESV